MKFLDKNLQRVKDNPFDLPAVFQAIRDTTNTDLKEMYEVFNMGHRLEIYAAPEVETDLIQMGKNFAIHAQKVGYTTAAVEPLLIIKGMSY
jgi:phosphoribosylformylglycinamidine cyclo-ligase